MGSVLARAEYIGMSELPAICVMLLTRDRVTANYAEQTLLAAMARLRYSGPLLWHIGDDTPEPEAADAHLVSLLAAAPPEMTASWSRGCGYGANYNAATMIAHQRALLVLPLEDDWELTRELNLDPLAQVLLDPAAPVSCIRMGYIGYTAPLRGEFYWDTSERQHYLLLDPASPEAHVFSGGPRLETVEFARAVGPWPDAEGMNAGAVEWEVAHRPASREGVAWPLDLIPPSGGLWNHVGSVQCRRDQVEAVEV